MLDDREECLICHAPLEYLKQAQTMECAICHREFSSNARCRDGHFVCDECHTRGLDAIVGICMAEGSKDPIEVMEHLMDQPFCHMHGPEHHTMVGAALLTAYHNAGGQLDLGAALAQMLERGRQVPGGACGFWGACGAGISAGIFVSIATGSTPLATKAFGLSNRMTSAALGRIGEVGGPRCCKRDSYLAILAATEFCAHELGVTMETTRPSCTRFGRNRQCLRARCPFYPMGVAGSDDTSAHDVQGAQSAVETAGQGRPQR